MTAQIHTVPTPHLSAGAVTIPPPSLAEREQEDGTARESEDGTARETE